MGNVLEIMQEVSDFANRILSSRDWELRLGRAAYSVVTNDIRSVWDNNRWEDYIGRSYTTSLNYTTFNGVHYALDEFLYVWGMELKDIRRDELVPHPVLISEVSSAAAKIELMRVERKRQVEK